jgi:DNA-binding helix-hairpin-helix protein with protein kinase domain
MIFMADSPDSYNCIVVHRGYPGFGLYVPQLRLRDFRYADWRFLVQVAEKLAQAVAAIHAAGG